MTIRLAVDGRGTLRKQILDQLVARSGGTIEVAVHFGDRDADFHAACLSRAEVRHGRKGHLIQRHQSRGAEMPLLASPDYFAMLEQGVEQLQRYSADYRYRSHNLTHLQDYLDYYHILADAYAQEIEETGATHALFMNIPHLGYDVILYHVAKTLGLKVVIVSQTFFADSFFSLERIEDFGHLNPDAPDGTPIAIEKGSAPDLFYMDTRWQERGPRGKLTAKAVLSLMKHMLLKRPGKLFSPSYIFGNLKRMQAVYGGLPDWRDPFSTFFHQNELAYFEHLAGYETQPVDLNLPFVYVPLHNQPEMSTQSLGGVFRDQVLAVEAMASVLPEGWRIYVKENPRQSAYARGPMFFHRLARIRGVQFVPSETSTHELSTRAKITATVAGTAGWEALRKGKPVVVFGGGWWRDFPGVFPWQPGMDLAAIAETTFPHDALEQAFGNLHARCHKGVIELLYKDRTKDIDLDANAEAVAVVLQGLLTGDTPVTFRTGGA
jgi:hypothetical protein